jgi:hypothetical protein
MYPDSQQIGTATSAVIAGIGSSDVMTQAVK